MAFEPDLSGGAARSSSPAPVLRTCVCPARAHCRAPGTQPCAPARRRAACVLAQLLGRGLLPVPARGREARGRAPAGAARMAVRPRPRRGSRGAAGARGAREEAKAGASRPARALAAALARRVHGHLRLRAGPRRRGPSRNGALATPLAVAAYLGAPGLRRARGARRARVERGLALAERVRALRARHLRSRRAALVRRSAAARAAPRQGLATPAQALRPRLREPASASLGVGRRRLAANASTGRVRRMRGSAAHPEARHRKRRRGAAPPGRPRARCRPTRVGGEMSTQLVSEQAAVRSRSARAWTITALGPGFWWLAIEPPLLVVAAGIVFAFLVAPGVIEDLEAEEN